MKRIVGWTVVYAIAMAFVESAVVVYLRALTHGGPFVPGGADFIPPRLLRIEVVREAATLVMLLALGRVAGRNAWERRLMTWLAFAVWDLAYYAWLWVLLGWPRSLFEWDVLFLIPVPWTGPVLAPILVSLGLIVGVGALLRVLQTGQRPSPRLWKLGAVLVGGLLILASFTLDFRAALQGHPPDQYHWGLFGVGFATAAVGFLAIALPERPWPDRS